MPALARRLTLCYVTYGVHFFPFLFRRLRYLMRGYVQVILAAPQYARALLALWQARRCWYALEAAIIETQPATWNSARRETMLQLLGRMDEYIARATIMLTRRQAGTPQSDDVI